MSDFSHVDIRRLDFMLLLVLREGVRRQKLSEVAEVLGVTQAAISHSVGRLRDLFDDELFLRRPHGVEPTARALALAAQAEDILEAAGALLAPPPRFDPARDTRVVRLCALDYEVALLTAALEPILAEAPGLRLHLRALAHDPAVEALMRGEADIWLGYPRGLPPLLEIRPLFTESYALIARRGHPRLMAGAEVGLDAFCAEGHVVTAPGGTPGNVLDDRLAEKGLSRSVVVMTTAFFSTLDLVAGSDLVAVIPRRLAEARAERFGLMLFTPPLAPRDFTVAAVRHRRGISDPALTWLTDRMAGVFALP